MDDSVQTLRYRSKPFVGTTLDPARGPPISHMTWLSTFHDVMEVLRSPGFVQGGGGLRDSAPMIGGSLLSLSGPDHFERRRIEAPLFRRPRLAQLEREIFVPRLRRMLDACSGSADGRLHGDAMEIVRAALLGVSSALVGLDLDGRHETERHLLSLMAGLATGVNLEWLDRDHRDVIAEVEPVIAAFRDEFFAPSYEVRRAMSREAAEGRRPTEALPNDLITLILTNDTHFGRWDDGIALREVILVNGAPSSIPFFAAHALEELLVWAADDQSRGQLLLDRDFLRHACLETLRIHPATPFLIRRASANVTMPSGIRVAAGEYVVVDLFKANRDPTIYPEPDTFDPCRKPVGELRPGILAFGSGPHTCIGISMTIGEARQVEDSPAGIMILALHELFRRGVRRDPDRNAAMNPANVRNEYVTYPISFSAKGVDTIG